MNGAVLACVRVLLLSLVWITFNPGNTSFFHTYYFQLYRCVQKDAVAAGHTSRGHGTRRVDNCNRD